VVLLAIAARSAQTQDPPSSSAAVDDGVEVLARGPVHEAFASTAEFPINGSPVIVKAPPEAIEELPPEQKPEGENVQWLPGYWSWDDDRSDYLWVSGFWRNAPPSRVWVAGNWREVAGGFQWVQGFWKQVRPLAAAQAAPPVEEIRYLPPPPPTIEIGPTIPAPEETSVYVPGCWVWQNRYVWRPGVWITHRPGWIWTPARYCWSPAGYVFVDGYWDYPLDSRGLLFAPVYFSRPIYAAPAYVYSPTIVIAEPCLYGSLFVRRGWGSYYFGDYFDRRHVGLGYTSWTGLNVNFAAGGVNVNLNVGRGGYAYDPLWSYYRTTHRHNPAWIGGMNDLYTGRYRGTILRPPHTLVQQRTVVNNIANNTVNIVNRNEVKNTIVTNNVVNNINNVTMLTSITNVQRSVVNAPQGKSSEVVRTERVKLQPVNLESRVQEQSAAGQIRKVGAERRNSERQIATQGGPPKSATDTPRTAPLAVPQPVVARSRPRDTANTPPPNPLQAQPVTPKGGPNVEPKTGIPAPTPRVEPTPAPKIAPSPAPLIDPKTPAVPKSEPKMPNTTPKTTPPVDSKLPPTGTQTTPKGEPKGSSPPIPRFPPVANPPMKTPPAPMPKPMVTPPQPAPMPKPMVTPPQPAPMPTGKPPQSTTVPPPRSNPPTLPPVPAPKTVPPITQPPQPQPRPAPPAVQPQQRPQPPVTQPRPQPPVPQPRPQPPVTQPQQRPVPAGTQPPQPPPMNGPPQAKKPRGNPGQPPPPS